MNTDELRQYARELVADWPPLTEDQRARLAVLLRPDPPADLPATPVQVRKKAA